SRASASSGRAQTSPRARRSCSAASKNGSAGSETRARAGNASANAVSRSSETSSSTNACKTGRSITKDGTRGSAARIVRVPRLVEALLRGLQAVARDRLDRVRGTRNKRLDVLFRVERREHVIGNRARVAAARPADADPQPHEVLRPERLRERAQSVVAGE